MSELYLYPLTQTENLGYDTYDAVVVAAEDEAAARMIMPRKGDCWGEDASTEWATKPENVTVRLIGKAIDLAREGVILASFNAG